MQYKKFTMKLYSKRALEFVQDWLKSRNRDPRHVSRGVNGELIMEAEDNYYLEDPAEMAKYFLSITKRWPRNTAKTLANDMETYHMNDKTHSFSEISLFACLVLHKYPMATLEKYWGAENVREFVGRPVNPLVAAQRSILMEQMERDEKYCTANISSLCDFYRDKIAQLRNYCQEGTVFYQTKRDEISYEWQNAEHKLRDELATKRAAIQAALDNLL